VAIVSVKKDRFRFFKQDHVGYGMVLGLLAPCLGCCIYYWIKMSYITFREFLNQLITQHSLLTVVTSLSLLANAILFTLYVNTGRDRTAKGIFLTTCLYVIAALLIKLL
jgi:hypothetical protein